MLRKGHILAILIISISFLTIPVFAETQSRVISASTLVDLGPLDIKAVYDLRFNIIAPSEIEAGDTVDITLIPTSGTVTSTVTLSGDRLGTFPTDIVLGQEAHFGIPGGYGVGLFAKTSAYVQPLVSGPGKIIYSYDLIFYDSMVAKTFRVAVNENIGNSNFITINLPAILATEIGANIDLILFKEKLASDSFQLKTSPQMSIKIPLKKFYNTNLSLQVKDGDGAGNIKVYPTLTYDGGKQLSLKDTIQIHVDGKYLTSVHSNQWSWNLHPGSGSHNFEAKFLGQRDQYNNAIHYSSSSDFESFTVKSTSSSSSGSSSSSSSKSGLKCGAGTHEENGECVADGLMGGGCLIATATFGSELAPQVQQLRELRDNSLLQTSSGTSFMTGFNQFYYSFSPTIADWERQNPVFKEAVKLTITPLITSLSLLNYADMDSEAEVLGYGISLIILNVGMYVVTPIGIGLIVRRKI